MFCRSGEVYTGLLHCSGSLVGNLLVRAGILLCSLLFLQLLDNKHMAGAHYVIIWVCIIYWKAHSQADLLLPGSFPQRKALPTFRRLQLLFRAVRRRTWGVSLIRSMRHTPMPPRQLESLSCQLWPHSALSLAFPPLSSVWSTAIRPHLTWLSERPVFSLSPCFSWSTATNQPLTPTPQNVPFPKVSYLTILLQIIHQSWVKNLKKKITVIVCVCLLDIPSAYITMPQPDFSSYPPLHFQVCTSKQLSSVCFILQTLGHHFFYLLNYIYLYLSLLIEKAPQSPLCSLIHWLSVAILWHSVWGFWVEGYDLLIWGFPTAPGPFPKQNWVWVRRVRDMGSGEES